MSKILGAWWWAFWSSTLIFLRDEGREMRHSQCFSPKKQCAFSLALPIHGNKKKSKKTKTKTTIKKNPHQKKTNWPHTHKKRKEKKGKIPLSWVFSSVAFCSSFRWRHGSLTNSGRSSAPTNTPQKCKKGDKRLCLCLLVAWQCTFSYFSLSERLFLSFCAAVLSSTKQKKHRQKVSYVLPGFHFSFLANHLL